MRRGFTFLFWMLALGAAMGVVVRKTGVKRVVVVKKDSVARKEVVVTQEPDPGPDEDIIGLPETPQTQQFVPTSIRDFKIANPAEGISLIDAPKANPQGNASLNFNLNLPAGRQGIQPDLPIQYSSDAGASWLGNGWNLSTPAVTLDTRWGVPRYDTALETEMYQLNGNQLAPTNNRNALVKRTAEKRFYLRIEGDFCKIIRHGSSPTNYWWEVTEKNGNRSSYGGTTQSGVVPGAVLKDSAGNIVYWALVETRDLNDNFVHYLYTTVTDVGMKGSSVPGQQIYPSQIYYTGTGSTDGPYKIEFVRDRQLGDSLRKDVTIDCRTGTKLVSADLLRKVNISFSGTLIRSYDLQYAEGAFYKQLLQSVSELDSAGVVFYTHRFDYYDDVNKANYTPADSIARWNMPGDGIQGDLPNQIPEFTSEASAINASKAMSKGGGGAVTVGTIFSDEWSKKGSVGGFFTYNRDDQEGLESLIDINGDGLPDKVFRNSGSLYYRPNLGGTSKGFGDTRPITGVSDISASNSITIGGGVQVIPYAFFLGYEHDETNTTTTVYFADFNGDGLVDIANNGQVYFNHLNAQGDPVFTTSSSPTPNPILSGSVDSAFLVKDTALEARQEAMFPLQDVVKMWEAPYDGTITISAPVQLLNNPNDTGTLRAKNDGVRVSIQQSGNVLWSTIIGPTDFSVHTPAGLSGIPVSKGQNIYFRVQSIFNGEDDQVSWDPVIDYTTPVAPTSDHKISTHYQASADFILHNKGSLGISKAGSIMVDGTFTKAVTTDTVSLMVVQLRNSVSTVLFQQDFAPADLASGALTVPSVLAVDTSDQLFFSISSKSYIDRSALQWLPHYAYTGFTDGTPATGSDGKPTMEGYPVPDNSNYNIRVIPVAPYVAASSGAVVIWPQVAGGGSGTLWLTIKGDDTIYARRQILLTGGAMSTAMDSIRMVRPANAPLYIEYATDSMSFAQGLSQTAVTIYRDSTVITGGVPADSLILDTVVAANLYANPDQEFLGPLFRGWGQFGLKGDTTNQPIVEANLNLNQLSSYPSNTGNYTDTASLSGVQDPTKTYFIALFPDARKLQWSGYDTSVFVMAAELSSSRVGMHDVSVDSTAGGGTAGSVNKQSKTVTDSYMTGVSAGPAGGSAGTSTATTTTGLDMMDLNGDGYPDIVNGTSVQYTLPGGGLGTKVIAQPIGVTSDYGTASGIGLGSDFTKANSRNQPKVDAGAAESTAKHAIGLSGGVESNDDHSVTSWMDINGDGLIDRIGDNGMVALNFGYRFGPPEPWGLGGIEQGSSLSEGAGVGLNLFGGSFEGGYGISRTTATNSFALNDVNGDGLPDQLSMSGGTLMVQLNTGNGFGPAIPWTNFNQVGVNTSTGEALNFAVTGVIPIPIIFIKIAINPFSNTGWGVARTNDAVMDLDGDGYADMLHSSNDGDLTASVSAIGRTNLLRGVKGPLGATITLDYTRAGNTYGMPQSKWVMSSETVFDGVSGDGVDTMRKQFSYSGGYQDRREREFYGFSNVTTQDLNTASQNKVYRSRVQQFLNNSYYSRGLLASEWLIDSAGNKYTQTNNQYNLRVVQDSVEFPALTQTQKLFYEGAATAGVSTIIQYDYDAFGNVIKISDAGDGSQQDLQLTTITYYDLPAYYVESVASSVVVTTAEGVKRKRTTTVDATGDIMSISQWLADGTTAKTDIEYDNYGNVTKVTQPANYKGQRMSYSYDYDSVVHNYNTKITDAFGYTTTKTYDYRFGLLTGMVNRNDEPTRYTLDNHGRMTSFTAPFEIAAGLPYTIAISYHPDSTISYAETRHYDPEYKADIRMVNFVDGLGRSVQVKKQVALFKGKDQADDVQMAVLGRQLLDAFGRPVKTFYPVAEAIGSGTDVFNTAMGGVESAISYDVRDRKVKVVLADGATTGTSYSTSGGMFVIARVDALNNRTDWQFDVRERKRAAKEYGPNGAITTTYGYDALNELVNVTDNAGNAFLASYDNFGRKVSAQHPDAGLTSFTYDLAGNVLRKTMAEIHKEMADSGAIQYQYDYNRLTDIDYPRYYQNKVKYTYGAAGMGSKAGRVTLVEDASGGQQYFYGLQGAVNKIIRTVLVNPVFATTFVSQQDYDTWGRIKTLTYPDGEAVTYHYNQEGRLLSMDGLKQGTAYHYVDQAGYDLYGERTYMRYGNGAENIYSYDSLRRRLVQQQLVSPGGQALVNNAYTYDAEDNVLGMVNTVAGQSGQLNGTVRHSYQYDNLYRLDSANGTYKGSSDSANYGVRVAYDDLYNIVQKSMSGAVNTSSYDVAYTYGKGAPHAAIQVGSNKYTYDANGNQLGYGDMENYYDEENRLMADINKGVLSQYTYDAEGVMVIRSSGGLQSVWVNGAPAGTVKHTNNYSAYVSPYLVSKSATFTKHYYIDGERIVSKLGHGTFVNISFPQSGLTAGNVDYVARAAQMQQNQTSFYASLGVSPGPPTDKNYYAEPQNSGIPSPVFVDSTANNAPPGWPADTLSPPNGPPVYLPTIPSNDSVKAGYGFEDAGHLYENDQYFFHHDIVGSTSYVTNGEGVIIQHAEYSPLGETFVEEHTGSYATPYLFHAKERDDETGEYAYGARFYDPKLSGWLTVADPLGDAYTLDRSGYGLLVDADEDDEASSPYMNPGVVVAEGLNPADDSRDGGGKSNEAGEAKEQAEKSRGPVKRNKMWQLILGKRAEFWIMLEQYGMVELETRERRNAVVGDRAPMGRRGGMNEAMLKGRERGRPKGNSVVVMHRNSSTEVVLHRGSEGGEVILHRRSSSGSVVNVHVQSRVRGGSSQGGNGVK